MDIVAFSEFAAIERAIAVAEVDLHARTVCVVPQQQVRAAVPVQVGDRRAAVFQARPFRVDQPGLVADVAESRTRAGSEQGEQRQDHLHCWDQ